MAVVALALLLTIVGACFGFSPSRAGSPFMWVVFGATQLPMAALAIHKLRRDGTLSESLMPRWGDISLGMGSAMVMLVGLWGASFGIGPATTKHQAWLMRIYLQIGDPELLQRNWIPVAAGVTVLASLEELSWRGLVLPVLEDKVGTRRAWPLSALLYALALSPSIWLLRDTVGPNPLVVGVALFGGMVWSFLAVHTRRLIPSILSHALFIWFVVAQFRLFTVPGR